MGLWPSRLGKEGGELPAWPGGRAGWKVRPPFFFPVIACRISCFPRLAGDSCGGGIYIGEGCTWAHWGLQHFPFSITRVSQDISEILCFGTHVHEG